jgi:hypothetical protein
LFSFYVNGASFLAYATIAAKRGLQTAQRGAKSIYFTAGLAEGTETIACFAAMMIWPTSSPPWPTASRCSRCSAPERACCSRGGPSGSP